MLNTKLVLEVLTYRACKNNWDSEHQGNVHSCTFTSFIKWCLMFIHTDVVKC